MDLETGQALEEPRSLWSGIGLMFPEAPHLYEIDGTWYLLIAEGGTERGHSVSIARGTRPDGPFEGCPANPVLSARSTARPVQNTGHADLVRTPDDGWALFLLGMRPGGLTRAFSPMGRETFSTTLEWVDGWPVAQPVELTPLPDQLSTTKTSPAPNSARSGCPYGHRPPTGPHSPNDRATSSYMPTVPRWTTRGHGSSAAASSTRRPPSRSGWTAPGESAA